MFLTCSGSNEMSFICIIGKDFSMKIIFSIFPNFDALSRKKTLHNARQTVSNRKSSGSDSSVKRAADIALVSSQKYSKKKIN